MLPWALPGNKDGIMDVLTITNHPLKQIMSLESPVAPTMKKMKAASLVFITRLHTPNYYYFGCWGWNVDGMAHGKPIFKMITIAPLWEREIRCWMSTSLGLPKQFSNFFLLVWLWLSRPIHYLTVVVYTTTFSVWPCNLHFFFQESHILLLLYICTTLYYRCCLIHFRKQYGAFYDIIENLFYRGDFLSEPL